MTEDFSDLPVLPTLSNPPTSDEIAELVHQIRHDLIGFLQSVKVGLELLEREGLDQETMHEVTGLIRANCERGFAYGRMLEVYVQEFETR